MRYKGTRKPIGEIAQELKNVQTIVEGTVMREAGRVAVTVQLIDATADAHLWSQSFERELTDMLTLRREIARSVAREIHAAIEPAEERRLTRRQDVTPEAFEAYLRSLEISRLGDDPQVLRAAREAARRAVTLDPGFAEAYGLLAKLSADTWWTYADRSPECAREAREAADRAIALDPGLAAAHRAKGIVLYQLDLDYEGALRELMVALERSPSDATALGFVGHVKRRQGKISEALTYHEKAAALDPLDSLAMLDLGITHVLLRQPTEALQSFDEVLRLSPTYPEPFAWKMRCHLRLRRDLTLALAVAHEAEAAGVGADPFVLLHRVLVSTQAGEDREALALLADVPGGAFDTQFWFMPVSLLEGQSLERLGQAEEARRKYAQARRIAEERLASDPDDPRAHSAFGLALAGLGEKQAAIREGRAAVEAMPVEKDAWRAAYRLEDLARIYAAVGERDAAVEILSKLLTMPIDLTGPSLVLDPTWASLRGHSGFEGLVAAPE